MINTGFIVLTWLLGAVATLGPVAVILGMIFVPAVAVPLISRIAKAFFDCVPCIIATAVVLACVASYWVGHHEAASDCRDEQLQAELRNKQFDLEKARQAASDEAKRAATIEEQANVQRKEDGDYIAHLEARPACALDESDIGGVPARQPRSGAKRPAATAR